MTPAEELRAAATQLRDRATGAVHEDRLTWATGHTLGSKSPVVVDDPEQPSVLIETYAARLEAVNRYLALLGPATGLALADWLDHHAAQRIRAEAFMDRLPDGADRYPLAVARAILGNQT